MVSASPPSEPYVRFSRIRLSGQWFHLSDCLASAWACSREYSPSSAKYRFGHSNQSPPFTPVSSADNMRFVQIAGSAHAHRARISDACLALPKRDTGAPVLSGSSRFSTIHLPAPLRSTGVTPLQRYYECSDSSAFILGPCAAQPPSLANAEASLLHAHRLPTIPSPTTPQPPAIAFPFVLLAPAWTSNAVKHQGQQSIL